MMMILGASVVVIATRKSRFADFFSNYALQLIIAPGCVDGDGWINSQHTMVWRQKRSSSSPARINDDGDDQTCRGGRTRRGIRIREYKKEAVGFG